MYIVYTYTEKFFKTFTQNRLLLNKAQRGLTQPFVPRDVTFLTIT